MKYHRLNADLFVHNRDRFVRQLKPNTIAIFVSNDEFPSNGDALHGFKQNSDLYWLTGIEQEDSMLVLFPDNPDPKYREVLVLVRPNELKEKWDGKRLRVKEAQAISGVETIVWVDNIEPLLQTWIHLADTICLDSNENDRKASWLRTREYRFIDEMQQRYPLHQYSRAAKIMRDLRAIKTPLEIEVVQKAIDITEQTFRRLLGFIKPGVMEYEVEAEIWHMVASLPVETERVLCIMCPITKNVKKANYY
jgi:Xaa-Pro aminopeptidase